MSMQPEFQAKLLQVLGYACYMQVLAWLKKDSPLSGKWTGAVSKIEEGPIMNWLEVQKEEEEDEPSPFSPLTPP